MKRLSWKYLAGLIDGEGCIDFQVTKLKSQPHLRFYIRPRLRIAMVEPSRFVLEMAQNSNKGHLYTRKAKPPHQDSVSWEVAGYKPVCPLLRNVVKHLFIKEQQARFCLWMENHLKGKQVSQDVVNVCREEMKLMKRDPHRLSEKAQERILAML